MGSFSIMDISVTRAHESHFILAVEKNKILIAKNRNGKYGEFEINEWQYKMIAKILDDITSRVKP